MKLPSKPPDLKSIEQQIANKGSFAFFAAMQTAPTEPEGKYLHWDKLRRWQPLPTGLTAEEYWFGIKSARMQARKVIPLAQMPGQDFWFTEPDQVRSSLHMIDRQAAGGIFSDNKVLGKADSERYLTRSLIEEPFSSSVLEGAATTREMARKLIDEGRKPRTKDERMVLNNYRAMRYVRDHVNDDLTIDMILEIHRIVSEGTLDDLEMEGVLRGSEHDINVVDEVSGEVLHKPPPAEALPKRLQALCDYANRDEPEDVFTHPIVKAIILHFMIGYDHPFVDGNGRTARALFYWYAIKSGYWLLEYVSISKTIMEAPVKYGRAYLKTESDDGDLTYFLIHQVGVLTKALKELYAYAERRSKQLAEFAAALDHFNHRQAFLLNDAARGRLVATDIETFRKAHKVSHLTARKDLEALVEAGLFSKRKSGRKSIYTPARNLVSKLSTATG